MEESISFKYFFAAGVIFAFVITLGKIGLGAFIAAQYENFAMSDWFLGVNVFFLILSCFLIDYKHLWFTRLLIICTTVTFVCSIISLLYDLQFFGFLIYYFPICESLPNFNPRNCLCGIPEDKDMFIRRLLRDSNCDNIIVRKVKIHVASCCLSFLHLFGIIFYLTYLLFALEHQKRELKLKNEKLESTGEDGTFIFNQPIERKKERFNKQKYDKESKIIPFRIIDIPYEMLDEINDRAKAA